MARDLIHDSVKEWEAMQPPPPQTEQEWINDTIMKATGGWCAPTEADYSLLDLPTVSIRRGGVTYGGH